ncbi:YeiH family protein [Porphyromonas levii]|uniref:YeiH family protein n=1 Tax=Porphyromonas levii TaxID=28114 RepID=UPI000361CB88|nr:putative sulfate exporter family transporter [Porphyromonas levii]
MERYKHIIYYTLIAIVVLGLACTYIPGLERLGSWITPPVALLMGLVFALTFGNVNPKLNKSMSKYLLQYSVVGLGFGMNLYASLESGKDGMLFTIASVIGTMVLGWLLAKYVFKVDYKTGYLISSGTAICGGSAIAAVGPVVDAKSGQMSVALGVIFILNAVALFIFPPIGRAIGMSQADFGLWAAIAIHDTSSVVGTGEAYGDEALRIATTVKLTRALWIMPLALVTAWIFKKKDQRISVPKFIFFFILAMLINTFLLQDYPQFGKVVSSISKHGLNIALFFIGAGLSLDVLKSVGVKAMLLGVALWLIISLSTLAYIFFL